MTINDQIRDEKLHYDINRRAAKISAISSGKIDKYEYLAGEHILPSNQQQIIEQAFEKQIKTIEGKGQKQIDAVKDLKDQNKKLGNISDYKDDLLHSKEREVFKNIYSKRLDEIEELSKKIDDNNLIFTTLSTGETVNFSGNNDSSTFFKKIRDGKITIERAKELQEDLNNNIKKYEKEIKLKSKKKKLLANLNILLNGRNQTIKFYNNYSPMILEAKKRAAEDQTEQEGTVFKTLSPKQMIQRLSIALAQVKAGNNSESLLNEIR